MAIAIETFLNPAKFTEELTSKLKDYRLPGIDVDAVVASQRNNVEALANASRAAFEGAQAVAKRQAEILQETMNQTEVLRCACRSRLPLRGRGQASRTREGSL